MNELNLRWHGMAPSAVLEQLGATADGLTEDDASERLARFGPNELVRGKTLSPWSILASQFRNVLIIILLIATLVSAFVGRGVEAIAIIVIVLFAVILGFAQEYKAERAIESLREMASPTATVLRCGDEHTIAAREVVPGDIVLLVTGDKVPADIRLLESHGVYADEAPLTGESSPVSKTAEALKHAGVPVSDRHNMLYAGTSLTRGRGKGVVVATGMSTELGQIAGMLQSVEPTRTPLQESLDEVGTLLGKAALLIVMAIVTVGLVRGQPFVEMLIFGIALAVAVVPEALPAVVTISLAIGVTRMARRNVLVRRLPAVETLGSTTVICSDKTGTITRDQMSVRRVELPGESWEIEGAGYDPAGRFVLHGEDTKPSGTVLELLKIAALASDARLVRSSDEDGGRWCIRGDPTEGALVVAAARAGLKKARLDEALPREEEIGFTSERKRMTTIHRLEGKPIACSKGAPEVILGSCSLMRTKDGVVPLDEAAREQFLGVARGMAEQALRVLAIATKNDVTPDNAESEMVFLGLAGMLDSPRAEVAEAIRICREAGIAVVMITGDHPVTARAVAAEVGIFGEGKTVITGPELDAMGQAELEQNVGKIAVYARVSPEHKLRIVKALEKGGEITAMTGDGVNDAPSLKQADIGIAMGITGTDVAREAAAMTLTDDNFASIVAAVEEGRGIFSNIEKYLLYLLSSNIGEIGLMAGAALAGFPMPLTAVQILYVNLATDGLPALALSVDPPEEDLMKRPPRDPASGIFTKPIVSLMLIGGIWSALVNLGVFVWALQSRTLEQAMTMAFVSLVLIQFFKAYNFRSRHESVLRRPFGNKWLNLAIVWEIALLWLILYVPILERVFETRPLSPTDWVIIGVAAFSVSPVLELAKWRQRNAVRVRG